jgi:NRPS condensation-like uncharacterized protein
MEVNMKIVIKPGINKVKVSYEGILDDYLDKNKLFKAMPAIVRNINNPLETKFSNPDINHNKEGYEKVFSNINHYYRDFNETFGKYINNTKDKQIILPANGHDICNYVARYGIGDFQIQAVMKFDSRLDFEKLKKAVRLSVKAEPVFGCSFVESNPPYWKRLDNINKVKFCYLEESSNVDEAIQRFLQSPLDMDNDPKVKLKLIRSEQYDTLCVKINHACCDGAGAKEYIQLLSEIYSFLDQENGTFKVKPRIGGRKDQDRLFSTLGINNLEKGWNPFLESPKTMWTFPLKRVRTNNTRFAICSLPQGQLDVLSEYGRTRGATINDLILTAYYRALFDVSHPLYGVPMDISSTIDLRRYLPDQKTKAIRNFSGGFDTRIARVRDEPFDGTLSRVMHEMGKVKSGNAGIQNAKGAEFIERMSFSKVIRYFKGTAHVSKMASQYSAFSGNVCLPSLSNLGFVSKSLIKFGKNEATEAYIVPPVIRAPGFSLLACTYNGVLTLVTGYYKNSIRHKDASGLLNKIKDELVNGCR